MMRSAGKGGNWPLLVILLIVAVVSGSAIATLPHPFAWAGFLTYTKSFGVGDTQPLTLDLSVLKLSFGIGLHINLAQAVCILAAVLLYRRFR